LLQSPSSFKFPTAIYPNTHHYSTSPHASPSNSSSCFVAGTKTRMQVGNEFYLNKKNVIICCFILCEIRLIIHPKPQCLLDAIY
jgi:hypothetical protein